MAQFRVYVRRIRTEGTFVDVNAVNAEQAQTIVSEANDPPDEHWRTQKIESHVVEVQALDPQPPFITVYKPIAGWKAVKMGWSDRRESEGPQGFVGYEPKELSPNAFPEEAEAIDEGRRWAAAEGIEFRGGDEVPLPVRS